METELLGIYRMSFIGKAFTAGATGTLAVAFLSGVNVTPAAAQTLEGSRWVGGITNTSIDSTCRSFGAYRIGDGTGWQLNAEIRDDRLTGLLTAKPGYNNKHEYKVRAFVGPGHRLERGTMVFGPYIAKFDGDIKGGSFTARWFLTAVGEIDCDGRIFMSREK